MVLKKFADQLFYLSAKVDALISMIDETKLKKYLIMNKMPVYYDKYWVYLSDLWYEKNFKGIKKTVNSSTDVINDTREI